MRNETGQRSPGPQDSVPPQRAAGTTVGGLPFSEETIKAVWKKSQPIPTFTHREWATDICGERIRFSYYGKAPSQFAWEIDHIVPVSRGGTDAIENLQPLQWENNRRKGDTTGWRCGPGAPGPERQSPGVRVGRERSR